MYLLHHISKILELNILNKLFSMFNSKWKLKNIIFHTSWSSIMIIIYLFMTKPFNVMLFYYVINTWIKFITKLKLFLMLSFMLLIFCQLHFLVNWYLPFQKCLFVTLSTCFTSIIFGNILSAILWMQYEIYCTLLDQSDCRYFCVLAKTTITMDFNFWISINLFFL